MTIMFKSTVKFVQKMKKRVNEQIYIYQNTSNPL